MKIDEIVKCLDSFAPLSLQEHYDNSGLILGDRNAECTAALLCIDVTEEVIAEAVSLGANLVVAHHPIIFGGLKRITGKNYVERTVIKAIKNDVAIYACHTNLDVMPEGVSKRMCDKLGLTNCMPLDPVQNLLKKLVCFVPTDHANAVRNAIFEAGAGSIGNYDCCSYNIEGQGTFRANEAAKPFVGEIGQIHHEKEIRIETIFPSFLENAVIKNMLKAHPYEEVAYDIYSVSNKQNIIGLGMIGSLAEPMDEIDFLNTVKETFHAGCLRYTPLLGKKVKKVALCGGSGSSLLSKAIGAGADVFITADFKYHQFFDAENRLVIADIGHYESEQFTKEIFFETLSEKFPNFAFHFSQVNTNPINYL